MKEMRKIVKQRNRLLKVQKKRSKSKSSQELDVRYLGQRLPGTPSQRAKLLGILREMIEEEGETWVEVNRDVLLKEAELLVDSGISF